MRSIEEFVRQLAAMHPHLCPRQVLGVRMGLHGGAALGLDVPRTDKRLLVLVETDGCGADGISVATGCWIGRRTLRVVDYGKLAATFVDTHTSQAVRVVPRAGIREAARRYAPEDRDRWTGQLEGCQLVPRRELLLAQPVTLTLNLEKLIGQPGLRVTCQASPPELKRRNTL